MMQVRYFKVSYVVAGREHPGAIMSSDHMPRVGEHVTFDGRAFEITEVIELMPPAGEFGFMHATCRYLYDLPPLSSSTEH